MFFDRDLLASFKQVGSTLWVGENSPVSTFETSNNLKSPDLDFRENPKNHGRFDRVCLIEKGLGDCNTWQLELDEALRTLKFGPCVQMHIRLARDSSLTLAEFVNHLKSKEEITVHNLLQNQISDGTVIVSAVVVRNSNMPSASTIDFGVITDGQRAGNVRALIRSIEKLRNPRSVQIGIIICGPPECKDQFSSDSVSLKFLSQPAEHSDLGWITKKKNLIASYSKSENIVVIHDRYKVANDFLTRLDDYGWDFGVVVPSQLIKEAGDFPDWVATEFRWKDGINFQVSKFDYHPNIYINGGAVLAKREILLKNPWEELLMWNQREDVELSRRLQSRGYVPRYASTLRLQSTGKDVTYLAGFSKLDSVGNTTQEGDALKSPILNGWIVGTLSRLISSRKFEGIVQTKAIKWFKTTTLGRVLGAAVYQAARK